MAEDRLRFEQKVAAAPAAVARAFTNSMVLRTWLSDVASITPRVGGHMLLAWNAGYYMAGHYLTLDLPETVAFTWQGKDEPTPTHVTVTITPDGSGSRVALVHGGLGEGEAWERVRAEFERAWPRSLENLASVLSTGADLRFTQRPMLGVLVGLLDETRAEALGLPSKDGILLDGVAPGGGAAASGLVKDDVIVRLGDSDVSDFPSLQAALQGLRAGDAVPVVYYRDGDRQQLELTLGGRAIPEIPDNTAQLAEELRRQYARSDEELAAFVADLDEGQETFRPAAGDWNVLEVLAHLLISERAYQQSIADITSGHEPWYENYAGNSDAQVAATVAVFATAGKLAQQIALARAETIALLEELPISFAEQRDGFWRVALGVMDNSYDHQSAHMAQMRAAVEAAGSSR